VLKFWHSPSYSGSGAGERSSLAARLLEEHREVVRGFGPFGTVMNKYLVNPFGVMFVLQQLLLVGMWSVGLVLSQLIYLVLQLASFGGFLFDAEQIDPNKKIVDQVTTLWAYLTMKASGNFPDYHGLENAPDEPALYVCNHASWMDVPIAGVMFEKVRGEFKKKRRRRSRNNNNNNINNISDNVSEDSEDSHPEHEMFKFLAKEELRKAPVLGNAIALGGHIMVDRDCRRSKIKAFRAAKKMLDSGVSIFTFPEGTRSPDGRLQSFQGGAFKIATACGAKVVPVSLVSTHHVMPKVALFPTVAGEWLGANKEHHLEGEKLAVVIHDPIITTNKTEAEVAREAFDAIARGLPESQKPKQVVSPLATEKAK